MVKTKAVTFNMPVELHWQLRVLVGPKKMSRFVCDAVKERISDQKKRLRDAYLAARQDSRREKAIDEWKITEGENWQ
ncbi:MAG: hypothetical protein HYS56_01735 [Candidatus Omnitrophica bacterium]|nr:hypothetical protein [Candidatus Omnitrophota bacterium]